MKLSVYEYLSEFKIGDVDMLPIASEETEQVIRYLNGEIDHVIPSSEYSAPIESLMGVFARLRNEYNDYHLTCINTYLSNGGEFDSITKDITNDYGALSDYGVPYNGDDSYTMIISNIPFTDLQTNPTLIDTAFITVFGIRVTSIDNINIDISNIIECDSKMNIKLALVYKSSTANISTKIDVITKLKIKMIQFLYKNLSMNISANSTLSARANVSWNVQNGNVIYIVDPNTFVRYLPISNVMNPLISEQINAQYTFSFETLFDGNAKYMNNENMIEIENDYFKVNRMMKERGSSVSMSVNCEHVSYQLIKKKDYPLPFEEIEDDPQTIMTTLLKGTPFTLGTVEVGGSYYIKPNSDNIRGALIELANLVGGELVFHQFVVSLVSKRGQDNGLEFKLGENLIGVTEEIDTTEDEPRHALEVDVLDLAQIPEYAYLATVGLGDTVRTFDPILEIDETLRIISREYNPFQKINPRVQIGHVIRDITEYIKEPNEDDESVEEDVAKYLSLFKIGTETVLSKASDETSTVREYLEGSANEVIPSGAFEADEYQYTGIFAKLSWDYRNYHFTFMLDAEQDGEIIIQSFPWSELESAMATFPVMLPETTYMAFTFIISDVAFADLQANSSLLETAFLKAFGVTVRLPGTEPVEPIDRKGTWFGEITNARDNGDQTVDVQMEFENETGEDHTWYPILNPALYTYDLPFTLEGQRAMMIDGIVIGVFTYPKPIV